MTKTSTNKDTKMLTVNIPADMFDKFKQECKTDNLSMSEAIKDFIQSYLDGNLEAMATGMIGDNTTAKQIEEAVERKIDDYISNEIDQVVTRHLETDLDVKLDSILEKKLDKYLDNKLESRLKAKLDNNLDNDIETNLENNTDNNLDNDIEHNLEVNTETNLDERLETQPQKTIGDDTETNLDRNLEAITTTAKNDETPANVSIGGDSTKRSSESEEEEATSQQEKDKFGHHGESLTTEESAIAPMTQAKLGERLGFAKSNKGGSVADKRKKLSLEEFKAWSREHDPDGIAWEYGGDKMYHPIE